MAMETQDVWGILKTIPVGTVVAWIVVIAAIVTAIVMGVTKLYKIFEKTHKLKEENLEIRDMVVEHDGLLKKISDQLDDVQLTVKKVEEHDDKLENVGSQLAEIKITLDKQDEDNLRKMRHAIVRAGEEALTNGRMTIREWKSLHELYDRYHIEGKGNGYVTSLMKKIDSNVDVIGKLNEKGEDIDDDKNS